MPVETELYELLEISVSATQEEIKKAYRKKALQHHPDKGGDPEVFKKINGAHEILSDPEKRGVYDKHGKDGLKSSGNVPEDVLSMMFGNMFGGMFGGGGFHHRGTPKTPVVIHTHRATLEDLCTRKIVRLKVARERLCACITDSNTQSCSGCSGRGIRMEVRHFGFLQQHVQRPCESCQGLGKVYKVCGNCQNGSIQDAKVFELFLNPELENGYKYSFHNEGNHFKSHDPGDFVVIIEYVPHSAFKVNGKKLTFHHTISLKEALCGHTLWLTHPDGELITVAPKDVIGPKSIEVVKGRGLTGDDNLEIEYTIVFPERLEEEDKEKLREILN